MEGTIAFTPEFHVFAGLVPGDSGIKIASVGTDYRFSIENESLKPGLGAIFCWWRRFFTYCFFNIARS